MKLTFIHVVDWLLKIIWFFQMIFAAVLIFSAVAIMADVSWMDIEKIKGFNISFTEINLGDVQMHDNQTHAVTLTNGSGRVHISGMDSRIVGFKIIGAFMELLVWMYVIYLLRRIFAKLKVGDYFIRSNGTTLRKIAISIIGISLFLNTFHYFISTYIYKHFSIEGVILKRTIELDTRTFLFGIMLFVIAQIFIKGAEIKEEQDLTI